MIGLAKPPDALHGLDTLTPVATLDTLYRLAALVPPDECVVEIGTYRGASACWLASGAQAGLGAHVYTIDPHDLPGQRTTTGRRPGSLDFTAPAIREHAERQITQVGMSGHVTMIRGFSVEVARTWTSPPVGLLFVDGDHREGAARRDLREWQPRLARDAVIAWDDYAPSHPGVSAAVAGLVARGILTPPDLRGRLAITGLVPPAERPYRAERATT